MGTCLGARERREDEDGYRGWRNEAALRGGGTKPRFAGVPCTGGRACLLYCAVQTVTRRTIQKGDWEWRPRARELRARDVAKIVAVGRVHCTLNLARALRTAISGRACAHERTLLGVAHAACPARKPPTHLPPTSVLEHTGAHNRQRDRVVTYNTAPRFFWLSFAHFPASFTTGAS